MKHLILYILILTTLNGCSQNTSSDTIHVDDNLDIPLGPCMEANNKVLGNSINTKEFCKCFILKLYAQVKTNPEQLKYLKDGKIDQLPSDKKEQVVSLYQDCILQNQTNDSTTKMTITPRMAESMKNTMRQDLKGTEVEQTNDIEKYCDCILIGLQSEFTAKEIYTTDFSQSDKFLKLQENCLNKTKK